MRRRKSAIVVGAGIAGATTALELTRANYEATLVDSADPGHSAAASAGEHRILRSSHGTDELYTRWAREARLGWLELAELTGQALFVQSGAVMFATRGKTDWEDASRDTLARSGIPHFCCDADELGVRLPVFDPREVAYALWEPEAGFVYAKKALRATVAQFRAEGGHLRCGHVTTDEAERPVLDGAPLRADVIVMACGAWMGTLFRHSLGQHLRVLRQNVIMIAPPAGDYRYAHEYFPAWVDHSYPAYGIPAAGGYGFKAVINWRALDIDLDNDDRLVDETSIARTRRYIAHRFPGLARQPISDTAVCQIASTPDTHFIIDHHPEHSDMVLVAGDSGHLFKHGPVVGRFIAELARGKRETEARFRLRDRSNAALADRPQ